MSYINRRIAGTKPIQLYVGLDDEVDSARVYDFDFGFSDLVTANIPAYPVKAAAFAPDNVMVLTGGQPSAESTIWDWDLTTGPSNPSAITAESNIFTILFDQPGDHVHFCGLLGFAKYEYSLGLGTLVSNVNAGNASFSECQIKGNYAYIGLLAHLFSGQLRTARIYNIDMAAQTGDVPWWGPCKSVSVSAGQLSDNSSVLAVVGDTELRLFRTLNGLAVSQLPLVITDASYAAFDSRDRLIVARAGSIDAYEYDSAGIFTMVSTTTNDIGDIMAMGYDINSDILFVGGSSGIKLKGIEFKSSFGTVWEPDTAPPHQVTAIGIRYPSWNPFVM